MMPLAFNFIRTQWRAFITTHPLIRGSISYAIVWPASSFIQQTLEGKNFNDWIACNTETGSKNQFIFIIETEETCDYVRLLRFSLYGSLFVAPTLYGWVKLSSAMWPQMNLRIGLIKASVEQVSYGPFACISFFMGMSLLEGKLFSEAIKETKEKFLPTYKVGFCIWPILQTINFSMIPEKNRIVFVSICSLLWTTFLAYMKRKELSSTTNETGAFNSTAINPL